MELFQRKEPLQLLSQLMAGKQMLLRYQVSRVLNSTSNLIPEPTARPTDQVGEGDGWQVEELEGLDSIPETSTSAPAATKSAKSGYYVPPSPGVPASEMWCRNSNLAVDHAAAGSYKSAMKVFNGFNSM